MIIGISGVAHSGKDTAALVLARRHSFIRVGFADKLKRFCQDIFQFSDAQIWGELKEAPDPRYPREDGSFLTPRRAMQQLGTEWGRDCYANIWVEDALRTAKRLTEEPRHRLFYSERHGIWTGFHDRHVSGVVFSDVRFLNEMESIKAAGGKLIRLLRGTGLSEVASAHSSEQGMAQIPDSMFDVVVDNRATNKEEFELEIQKVFERL